MNRMQREILSKLLDKLTTQQASAVVEYINKRLKVWLTDEELIDMMRRSVTEK